MTPVEVSAALDGGQFASGHQVIAWLLASRALGGRSTRVHANGDRVER